MSDATDARSLVTGTLTGILMQYAENPERPVLIDKVEVVYDNQGNYLPMVRLGMRSGARLLVIIAEDV